MWGNDDKRVDFNGTLVFGYWSIHQPYRYLQSGVTWNIGNAIGSKEMKSKQNGLRKILNKFWARHESLKNFEYFSFN